MSAGIAKAIFAYQMQEDRRLWDEAIMTLPESAFTIDTGYSWGSLQAECVHVVDVMQASLERVHGRKATAAAVAIDDPSRMQLRAIWDRVEAGWMSFFAQLDDRRFQQALEIVYRETAMTVPVWQTIFHVFNHNTLHRAEMRQMVVLLGGPAETDRGFLDYCLARSMGAGQAS